MLEDGMYPIDERAIADAMLARANLRSTIPGVEFAQTTGRRPDIRSFRHDPSARSFRLTSGRRVFH